MRLTETLNKVWSAINKIENVDFDQTGEEIKDDLLGIHRKFLKKNGIMDEVTDCLQELQEVVHTFNIFTVLIFTRIVFKGIVIQIKNKMII